MRGIIVITICLAIYFIPTFIAMYRSKINYFKIFILNALLGWTILAWVWCLIDSLRNDPAAVDVDELSRMAEKGIKNATINLKTGNIEEKNEEENVQKH